MTNLFSCVHDITFSSLFITYSSYEAWGATTGVATPATVSLSLWYFLQTSPDPTSCHDWVVPRVLPLDLRGPLKAQMVKSVIRQALQGGCMITTGTR